MTFSKKFAKNWENTIKVRDFVTKFFATVAKGRQLSRMVGISVTNGDKDFALFWQLFPIDWFSTARDSVEFTIEK